MRAVLLVGAGSFAGGVCRYLLALFIQQKFESVFPYGTLCVNIIGSFLIGLVFGLAGKGMVSSDAQLLLATGILGGFTTFSAFSNETIVLLRNGQAPQALLYVAASVLLGLLATYAAYLITR